MITRHDNFNFGAISSIKIALLENIGIFNILSQTQVNEIGFSSGDWTEIYFTPGKAELDISEKTDKNGSFYEISLTMSIPKLREDVVSILEQYRNAACIVAVTDKNGNTLIIGLPEQPAKRQLSFKIPSSLKDGNWFTVKFTGKQIPFPYFFY